MSQISDINVKVLSVKDVAKNFDVNICKVWRLVRSGKLDSIKNGVKKVSPVLVYVNDRYNRVAKEIALQKVKKQENKKHKLSKHKGSKAKGKGGKVRVVNKKVKPTIVKPFMDVGMTRVAQLPDRKRILESLKSVSWWNDISKSSQILFERAYTEALVCDSSYKMKLLLFCLEKLDSKIFGDGAVSTFAPADYAEKINEIFFGHEENKKAAKYILETSTSDSVVKEGTG